MMKKTRGLTLTELLIATAIFALVLLTVYASFHAGVLGSQNIEEAIGVSQSARHILERINLDLRNSFAYSADDSKFTGNPNAISFLAVVDNYSRDKIRQEFAFVSYKLEGDKLMRLCRLNTEALKEESAALPGEEMSSGIKEITFKYGYKPVSGSEPIIFDKDNWQNNPKLPLAVKVKLELFRNRAKDAEDTFERTVDTFERTIFLPPAR